MTANATPGCVFCAIAAGETPASMVLRDDHVAAFLDARPVFKGHVLVVPRAHIPTLSDAGADGTFVALNNKVSQSVPHLHVHVVPRRKKDGLRGFFWPRVPYADDAEREAFAAKIRAALDGG